MTGEVSNWSSDDAKAFSQIIAGEIKAPTEKRPLFRPLPSAPQFPLEVLGPLKEAAIAIHRRTQAPIAIAAQSVLAAATLAVQAQRDVTLPGGGQYRLRSDGNWSLGPTMNCNG